MIFFLEEAVTVRYFRLSKGNGYVYWVSSSHFFMFYIATHTELSYKPVYKHLRELGILIFYLHLLVLLIRRN
jgi:hypothetical protein